jgi:hypothetical protein
MPISTTVFTPTFPTTFEAHKHLQLTQGARELSK